VPSNSQGKKFNLYHNFLKYINLSHKIMINKYKKYSYFQKKLYKITIMINYKFAFIFKVYQILL